MKTRKTALTLLAALLLALCLGGTALAEGENLTLPGGKTVSADSKKLDLSALTEEQADQLPALLAEMPALTTVELGEEREDGPTWEQILAMEQAAPQAAFRYAFTLYGRAFTLSDTKMDLNHIRMTDGGALVRRVIACMPRLTWLCMDSCHVSNEDMAAIRDDFPEVEVVWRIFFGRAYSVRTDVEKILASRADIGGNLTSEELNRTIVYCTKLKYLDLGHNREIRDISFLYAMPEMEVLILAINHLGDLTPLASCPKLEFLELFMSDIDDLTPLSELTELRHLNISDCPYLTDITPIYGLELERLSLGYNTVVPPEQIEEFRRLHPDCWVDDFSGVPSQTGWRFTDAFDNDPDYKAKDYYYPGCHPRYALLRKQFGYNGDYSDYSYSWLDPNY